MTGIKGKKSTRRAFFLNGGAVLGAGVAATAGAASLRPAEQRRGGAEDREAIRSVHLAFVALVENQSYEAAADLFDEQGHVRLSGASATGKAAIERLFADQYRNQKLATLHGAYRQTPSQRKDEMKVSEDGLRATATFHCEVELCTPLKDDCTAAQMARLQGQVASRRWESGRFEASYVKTRGQWKMASVSYIAS
ncbi:MAG: nuclear transport factor 2 family protein [Gammaproteobacteria bacterium]